MTKIEAAEDFTRALGMEMVRVEGGECVIEVDLDERFELYSHLRRVLGERDSYWLEFDAAPEEMHMSGSLADDLTDIYFDLRYGLDLLDEVWPQRAAQAWQSTYRLHWGQHLVDAERHLYALKVRNQLALAE